MAFAAHDLRQLKGHAPEMSTPITAPPNGLSAPIRAALIAGKLLLSTGLVSLLLYWTDINAAVNAIGSARPLWLAAALGSMTGHVLIGASRWQIILFGIGSPGRFRALLRMNFFASFAGQVLPGGVGTDALRLLLLWRSGVMLSDAVVSVVLDRVAMTVALVFLVSALATPLAARLDLAILVRVGPLLLAATLTGMAAFLFADRLPSILRHSRVGAGLAKITDAGRRLISLPLPALGTLGLCVMSYANLSLCAWFICRALDLTVTLTDCMMLVPPILFFAMLPISMGGWGVREALVLGMFMRIGVPAAGALSLSVLFGLVGILATLPGAIIWLSSRSQALRLEATDGLSVENSP
jgi:uncharacterized protein (TIRG00374 family)